MDVSATAEARIDAPPEAVFDFTQDWSRRSDWDPEVLSAEDVPGTPRRARVKMRRGATIVFAHVVDERPMRVVVESESVDRGGPIVGAGGSATYEPDGDGTLYRLEMRVTVGGGVMAKMVAGVAKGELERAVKAAVANAKAAIEAS